MNRPYVGTGGKKVSAGILIIISRIMVWVDRDLPKCNRYVVDVEGWIPIAIDDEVQPEFLTILHLLGKANGYRKQT